MGRLSGLTPRLGSLQPLIARQTDAEGHSQVLEPWRRWYSTADWKALKAEVHQRDLFQCQDAQHDGPRLIQKSRERIADHIIPHRGERRLFFDVRNIQTLCKTCHDGRKQRAEARTRRG